MENQNPDEGVKTIDPVAPTGDDSADKKVDPQKPEVDPHADRLAKLEADKKALQDERDNYKTGLLNEKDKLKKAEEKLKEQDGKVDPSVLEEKLNEFKQTITEELKGTMVEKTVNEAVNKYGKTESERKLIKFIYDNQIKPTGYDVQSISADIESAFLLANRDLIAKRDEEFQARLSSEQGVAGRSSSYNRSVEESKVEFSAAEEAMLKGLKVDPKRVQDRIKNS